MKKFNVKWVIIVAVIILVIVLGLILLGGNDRSNVGGDSLKESSSTKEDITDADKDTDTDTNTNTDTENSSQSIDNNVLPEVDLTKKENDVDVSDTKENVEEYQAADDEDDVLDDNDNTNDSSADNTEESNEKDENVIRLPKIPF